MLLPKIRTLKQRNVLKFIEFLWFDGKHCIADMLFIMHSVYGKRIANWIDTIIKTATHLRFFPFYWLIFYERNEGEKIPCSISTACKYFHWQRFVCFDPDSQNSLLGMLLRFIKISPVVLPNPKCGKNKKKRNLH